MLGARLVRVLTTGVVTRGLLTNTAVNGLKGGECGGVRGRDKDREGVLGVLEPIIGT